MPRENASALLPRILLYLDAECGEVFAGGGVGTFLVVVGGGSRQRLAVVGDGRVSVAARLVRVAARGESACSRDAAGDGLVEVGDGLGPMAECGVDLAAGVYDAGVVGSKRDSLLCVREAIGGSAADEFVPGLDVISPSSRGICEIRVHCGHGGNDDFCLLAIATVKKYLCYPYSTAIVRPLLQSCTPCWRSRSEAQTLGLCLSRAARDRPFSAYDIAVRRKKFTDACRGVFRSREQSGSIGREGHTAQLRPVPA